ncbi:MerR family transcriptional regulator [Actinomadura sp. HBU206391]|uniref:MerR family transcriptional regulator n=1 Tax=Actinomadura sp. HBU206391 TaxID=2731692 RepID=UPI001C9C6C35|nr:MerR family transcriptional regulator [Actinomadura sp. HBU206391]
MRIGELAALVGVTTRTVRHYHHLGLLTEPGRSHVGTPSTRGWTNSPMPVPAIPASPRSPRTWPPTFPPRWRR